MQLGTITGVMLDFDGAPVGFSYLGRQYLVASRPVRWYSRRLWWSEAESAAKGLGSALVEVEMWRLWAASDSDRSFFELRHSQPQGNWEIIQITS
ncbi:MAG: hypothetical protein RL418_808 [Actinomycetota bacterium]